MKPNILDRNWKYVPSAKTNLKATFARIKREQKAEADKAQSKVTELRVRA